MNRRSFLRFLGVAPVAAPMAAYAMTEPLLPYSHGTIGKKFSVMRCIELPYERAVIASHGEEVMSRRYLKVRNIGLGDPRRGPHGVFESQITTPEYIDGTEAVSVD